VGGGVTAINGEYTFDTTVNNFAKFKKGNFRISYEKSAEVAGWQIVEVNDGISFDALYMGGDLNDASGTSVSASEPPSFGWHRNEAAIAAIDPPPTLIHGACDARTDEDTAAGTRRRLATCGDQDVSNCCLTYHNCLTNPKFSIGGRWSPCKQAWCCANKPNLAAKWGDAVSCISGSNDVIEGSEDDLSDDARKPHRFWRVRADDPLRCATGEGCVEKRTGAWKVQEVVMSHLGKSPKATKGKPLASSGSVAQATEAFDGKCKGVEECRKGFWSESTADFAMAAKKATDAVADAGAAVKAANAQSYYDCKKAAPAGQAWTAAQMTWCCTTRAYLVPYAGYTCPSVPEVSAANNDDGKVPYFCLSGADPRVNGQYVANNPGGRGYNGRGETDGVSLGEERGGNFQRDGVVRFIKCDDASISIQRSGLSVNLEGVPEWQVSFGNTRFYSTHNAGGEPPNSGWKYNAYSSVSRKIGSQNMRVTPGACPGFELATCGKEPSAAGFSGSSWLGYDHGVGQYATVSEVKLLQHTNVAHRISNAVIEFSDDGASWLKAFKCKFARADGSVREVCSSRSKEATAALKVTKGTVAEKNEVIAAVEVEEAVKATVAVASITADEEVQDDCTGLQYKRGASVTYGCEPGYVLTKRSGQQATDASTRICGSAGAWTGSMATCERVDCSGKGPNECGGLNREACFATAGTCGACLDEYEGEAGDSNSACTVSCALAPPCQDLNRESCSTTKNTCGACKTGYTPEVGNDGSIHSNTVRCRTVCTTATAAKCAAFNRQPCAGTFNKCGPCLDNFEGTAGDANDKCEAPPAVVVTDNKCAGAKAACWASGTCSQLASCMSNCDAAGYASLWTTKIEDAKTSASLRGSAPAAKKQVVVPKRISIGGADDEECNGDFNRVGSRDGAARFTKGDLSIERHTDSNGGKIEWRLKRKVQIPVRTSGQTTVQESEQVLYTAKGEDRVADDFMPPRLGWGTHVGSVQNMMLSTSATEIQTKAGRHKTMRYCVANAGNPDANGWYIEDGLVDGVAKFRKGPYTIQRYNHKWSLLKGSTRLYERPVVSVAKKHLHPPRDSWVRNELAGILGDAPDVTRERCATPNVIANELNAKSARRVTWCITGAGDAGVNGYYVEADALADGVKVFKKGSYTLQRYRFGGRFSGSEWRIMRGGQRLYLAAADGVSGAAVEPPTSDSKWKADKSATGTAGGMPVVNKGKCKKPTKAKFTVADLYGRMFTKFSFGNNNGREVVCVEDAGSEEANGEYARIAGTNVFRKGAFRIQHDRDDDTKKALVQVGAGAWRLLYGSTLWYKVKSDSTIPASGLACAVKENEQDVGCAGFGAIKCLNEPKCKINTYERNQYSSAKSPGSQKLLSIHNGPCVSGARRLASSVALSPGARRLQEHVDYRRRLAAPSAEDAATAASQTARRFWRIRALDDSGVTSGWVVNEVQFYDGANNALVKTGLGAAMSSGGEGADKAFDGSCDESTTDKNGKQCSGLWEQCGGEGHTGPTCCVEGAECVFGGKWYSQCKPSDKDSCTTSGFWAEGTQNADRANPWIGYDLGAEGKAEVSRMRVFQYPNADNRASSVAVEYSDDALTFETAYTCELKKWHSTGWEECSAPRMPRTAASASDEEEIEDSLKGSEGGLEEEEVSDCAVVAGNQISTRKCRPESDPEAANVPAALQGNGADGNPKSITCKTFGDPHFHMFSDHRHNFQAEGEFVLAKRRDDTFEAQVCHKAILPNFPASVNAHISVKYVHNGLPYRVSYNGANGDILVGPHEQETNPTVASKKGSYDGTAKADGLKIAEGVITFPSGDVINVDDHTTHINIDVTMQAANAYGNVHGLCGAMGPDPQLAFERRDGCALPPHDAKADHRRVHNEFGMGWRVASTGSGLGKTLLELDGIDCPSRQAASCYVAPAVDIWAHCDEDTEATETEYCTAQSCNAGSCDAAALENCLFDAAVTCKDSLTTPTTLKQTTVQVEAKIKTELKAAGCGFARFDADGKTMVVREDSEEVSFTVMRALGSAGTARVKVSTRALNATSGVDFEEYSEILEWQDGVIDAKRVSLKIFADTDIELTETFQVVLEKYEGEKAEDGPSACDDAMWPSSSVTVQIVDTTELPIVAVSCKERCLFDAESTTGEAGDADSSTAAAKAKSAADMLKYTLSECTTVKCDEAPACEALRRESCALTANTCGPCIDGFVPRVDADATVMVGTNLKTANPDGNSLCVPRFALALGAALKDGALPQGTREEKRDSLKKVASIAKTEISEVDQSSKSSKTTVEATMPSSLPTPAPTPATAPTAAPTTAPTPAPQVDEVEGAITEAVVAAANAAADRKKKSKLKAGGLHVRTLAAAMQTLVNIAGARDELDVTEEEEEKAAAVTAVPQPTATVYGGAGNIDLSATGTIKIAAHGRPVGSTTPAFVTCSDGDFPDDFVEGAGAVKTLSKGTKYIAKFIDANTVTLYADASTKTPITFKKDLEPQQNMVVTFSATAPPTPAPAPVAVSGGAVSGKRVGSIAVNANGAVLTTGAITMAAHGQPVGTSVPVFVECSDGGDFPNDFVENAGAPKTLKKGRKYIAKFVDADTVKLYADDAAQTPITFKKALKAQQKMVLAFAGSIEVGPTGAIKMPAHGREVGSTSPVFVECEDGSDFPDDFVENAGALKTLKKGKKYIAKFIDADTITLHSNNAEQTLITFKKDLNAEQSMVLTFAATAPVKIDVGPSGTITTAAAHGRPVGSTTPVFVTCSEGEFPDDFVEGAGTLKTLLIGKKYWAKSTGENTVTLFADEVAQTPITFKKALEAQQKMVLAFSDLAPPTLAPTLSPTPQPTAAPTPVAVAPTPAPTPAPTRPPSPPPTPQPTFAPTARPTPAPTPSKIALKKVKKAERVVDADAVSQDLVEALGELLKPSIVTNSQIVEAEDAVQGAAEETKANLKADADVKKVTAKRVAIGLEEVEIAPVSVAGGSGKITFGADKGTITVGKHGRKIGSSTSVWLSCSCVDADSSFPEDFTENSGSIKKGKKYVAKFVSATAVTLHEGNAAQTPIAFKKDLETSQAMVITFSENEPAEPTAATSADAVGGSTDGGKKVGQGETNAAIAQSGANGISMTGEAQTAQLSDSMQKLAKGFKDARAVVAQRTVESREAGDDAAIFATENVQMRTERLTVESLSKAGKKVSVSPGASVKASGSPAAEEELVEIKKARKEGTYREPEEEPQATFKMPAALGKKVTQESQGAIKEVGVVSWSSKAVWPDPCKQPLQAAADGKKILCPNAERMQLVPASATHGLTIVTAKAEPTTGATADAAAAVAKATKKKVGAQVPVGTEVPVADLDEPIEITIPTDPTVELTNPGCFHWNHELARWDEKGCTVTKVVPTSTQVKKVSKSRHLLSEPKGKVKIATVSATSVTCQCTHLTEFVVMNIPDDYHGSDSGLSGVAIGFIAFTLVVAAAVGAVFVQKRRTAASAFGELSGGEDALSSLPNTGGDVPVSENPLGAAGRLSMAPLKNESESAPTQVL
jgi:hypothetical protein